MTVQHGATLAVIAIAGRLPDKRPSAPIGSRRAAPRTRARRPPIVSASHLAAGATYARGRAASGSLRPAPSTIGYIVAAAADEIALGHMDSGSGPEICSTSQRMDFIGAPCRMTDTGRVIPLTPYIYLTGRAASP